MTSLALLIGSLGRGGAERQLTNLAVALHHHGVKVNVVVLHGGGALEAELRSAGVPLHSPGDGRRGGLARTHRWLASTLRRLNPRTLYSFIITSNLHTIPYRFLHPRMELVWGVRCANFDFRPYGLAARAAGQLERRFSRLPHVIIANSHAAARSLPRQGYPAHRIRMVPNGIDTDRFRHVPGARMELRSRWQIRDEQRLVGLVARYDPVKGHELFIQTAAAAAAADSTLRFACVGVDAAAAARLGTLTQELQVDRLFRFVPPSSEMPEVFSALDIACLCSESEGFPNVLAEAMSCGVPCVSTDVGDASEIVSDLGVVVRERQPTQLAEGVHRATRELAMEDARIRATRRQRIVTHFGLDALVQRTLTALDDARAANRRHPPGP